MMLKQLKYGLVAISLTTSLWGSGQIFIEVGESMGLEGAAASSCGNGCALIDIDQDGWDDVALSNNGSEAVFFRNVNGESFEEWDLGLDVPMAHMVSFADIDNDGDLDAFFSCYTVPNRLFENQDGVFVEMLDAGIIEENGPSYGHTWGDYDNDGWLDLYVCNFTGADVESLPNRLYRNNGDQTFTELGELAGVDNGINATFQAVFTDVNQDGLADLLVVNDRSFMHNAFYKNNGDGTFQDLTFLAGFGDYIFAMSCTVGDYDNDGRVDVQISNDAEGNLLKRWAGNGFQENAVTANLEVNEFCWGSSWMDFDNDGWKDIVICTEHNLSNNSYGRVHVYRNNQSGTFTLEIDEQTEFLSDDTYAISSGDIDRDGHIDFITYSKGDDGIQLWQNQMTSGSWLSVELEGTLSNRFGIGAEVTCYIGDDFQWQQMLAGGGYMSQNPYRLHFGLDDVTLIDSLVVDWPSGLTDRYYDVPVNQEIELVEGDGVLALVVDGETPFCDGEHVTLSSSNGEALNWSTGTSSSSLIVSQTGSVSASLPTVFGGLILSDTLTFEVVEHGDWAVELTAPLCFPDSLSITTLTGADTTLVSWIDPVEAPELAPGMHTLYFEVQGCPFEEEVQAFAPLQILTVVTGTEPSCFGYSDGTLSAQAAGGTGPVVAEWQNVDPAQAAAGNYICLFTDSLGCEVEVEYELAQPELLEVSINESGILEDGTGTLEAITSGGTPPYTFTWNGIEGSEFFDITEPSTIELVVTDSLGCLVSAELTTTGTDDINGSPLRLFPTPATLEITITGLPGMQWRLYDLNGRQIKELILESPSTTLSVADLAPGMYSATWAHDGRTYKSPLLIVP